MILGGTEVQMASRKKRSPAVERETSKPKVVAPSATTVQSGNPEPRRPTLAKSGPKPAQRARLAPSPKRAAKRPRRRYSTVAKARILKVAAAESLTAQQVQARFGVKPVTYYSWRKKAKLARKRDSLRVVRGETFAGVVRESVQERLRAMLPEIVRSEVAAFLSKVFKKGR